LTRPLARNSLSQRCLRLRIRGNFPRTRSRSAGGPPRPRAH
jgi:hypothetical protein